MIGAACMLIAALNGCELESSGTSPIKASSAAITIAWDPPSVRYPSGPLALSVYRVYYRNHGDMEWLFYKEVPATENPQIKLPHADFNDGSFDFAVSAVNEMSIESPLHSSTDASAAPYGGWHLVWMQSN
jgi:hypothetical protein